MRDILKAFEQDPPEPFALATVIRTWGSAPRPEGAHMAVLSGDRMIGSVSGGCVENAVVEAARECMENGKSQILTFGVSDETAWQVGLACGGTIQILLQRMDTQSPLFQQLAHVLENKKTAVLASYVGEKEAWLGRQLLVTSRGPVGGIDNGRLDQQIQQSIDLTRPPREPMMQSFAGHAVFIEPILPPARLIVVGGVHIAIPLTRMAAELDFEVILVDPRSTFANPERFPHLRTIINEWPDVALTQLGIDENTFIVTLSHDAKIDDPALAAALQHHPAYIGALGSQRTHEKRLGRLRDQGFTEAQLRRIAAPIGLSIGARSPAEIAVAILAQITAVRHGVAASP